MTPSSWRRPLYGAILLAGAAAIALVGLYLFWTNKPAPIVTYATLDADNGARRYRLASPATPPRRSLPLVVALHGVGDSADSMAAYSGLDQLAADSKAYVVYPEAKNGMWNVFDVAAEKQAENGDLQLLDSLIARLRDQLPIESVRLVGMSNGATFAQFVAQTRSDIEVIVAHSGSRLRQEIRPSAATPILLVVGADDLAAASVRRDADHYRAAGYVVELLEEPGLGHAWSARHSAAIRDFLVGPGELTP